MNGLVLWSAIYGLGFFVLLLIFGDLLWSMFDTFQKTKTKGLRYFLSTGFLLILFIALRLLNNAFDVFSRFFRALLS